MQLAFIWLKEYGIIKEQSINFGSRFIFIFDNAKLSISKNKEYIQEFFTIGDNDKILNVTGIVGENGAGKSTLIDYLKNFNYSFDRFGEIKGRYNPQSDDKIVIFIDENEKKLNLFCTGKDLIKQIDNDILDDEGFELFIYPTINNESILKIITIYFSNVFYTGQTVIHNSELKKDISLSCYLNKVCNNYKEYVNIFGSSPHHPKDKSILERYTISPLKKYNTSLLRMILKMLSDKRINEYIDFSLPSKITMQLDIFSNLSYQRNLEKYSQNKSRIFMYNNKLESKMYTIIDNLEIHKGDYCRAFLKRIIAELFDVIEVVIKHDKFRIELNEYIDSKFEDTNEYFVADLFDTFGSYLNELSSQKDYRFDINYISYIIENFKIFFKISINFIKNIKIQGIERFSISRENFPLPILDISSKKDKKLLKDLLDSYYDLHTATEFLIFDWQGVSSGQEAYLNTIARFYDLKDYFKDERLFIILDECELYLHPEWQRKNLYTLLKMLNYIYSNVKSIQLLLSSNSPFVLSDLPVQNVIFIKDGVIENSKCKKQTFAANIFTLLRNDFFMTSTIGEYANRKIKNLVNEIEMIEKKEKTDISDENKKILNIIGEPYLKKILIERYSNSLKESEQVKRIDEKIRNLQKEKEKILLGEFDNDKD